MDNFFIPLDLSKFPKMDTELEKDKIIQATKQVNKLLKDSHSLAKLDHCYYCGKKVSSFCNSHFVPAFCLRNIADNGKVNYMNTIIDLPVLKENKGVKDSGTFRLICRDCDSKIFQDYENPDNYNASPSMKMLSQISMKNNLKFIEKRRSELELYNLMKNLAGDSPMADFLDQKNVVSTLDLKEFEDSFLYDKNCDLTPSDSCYSLALFQELPYKVPLAFQGFIALITDIDGGVINDIYNLDPQYIIKNLSLCVFPLKDRSIIIMFVEKDNLRYNDFFSQLKQFSLNEQLQIINYIIFAYCEDYFLSPLLSKDTLDKLRATAGKTSDLAIFPSQTTSTGLNAMKTIYNYSDRFSIPNLLSEKYCINL